MPNALGLILWGIGILAIVISIYIFHLINRGYLKDKFNVHSNLIILLLIIFTIFRIYVFFYTNYLNGLNLSSEILTEKLLFIRMFSHIPLALAVSIFLVVCYGCLAEIKYKLKKS